MSRYTTYTIKERSALSLPDMCEKDILELIPDTDVLVSWVGPGNLIVRFPGSDEPERLFRAVQRPVKGNGIGFVIVEGQQSSVHFHVKRKFTMRLVSSRSTRIAHRVYQ